jgi:hypothetical protein
MIRGKKKAHPADGLFLRETQGEVKKILFLTPTHTRHLYSKPCANIKISVVKNNS